MPVFPINLDQVLPYLVPGVITLIKIMDNPFETGGTAVRMWIYHIFTSLTCI